MKQFFEVLIFVTIGIVLLWFGYTLFFSSGLFRILGAFRTPGHGGANSRRRGPPGESFPGDPKTCPVCSAKLEGGELVSSAAYPSMNGGIDRFMHIRGCVYCLRGDRDRVCPVCGTILKGEEILISRLFERPGRRSHVHVIGCSQCKGPRSQRLG